MEAPINIALVGNPNSGKSSLFNALTGLNQKVSNFPGVTVDKKTGSCRIASHLQANIIDLPGTYSLYPKSADEYVTYEVLINPSHEEIPDLVIIVTDAANLKRNLLFCSQIMDLKIPVIIALTMMDIARKKGIEIDLEGLESRLGVPVVAINPRRNKGLAELKKTIEQVVRDKQGVAVQDFINNQALAPQVIRDIRQYFPAKSDYAALHVAVNVDELPFLNGGQRLAIRNTLAASKFNKTKMQAEEIMLRYARIKTVMKTTVVEADPLEKQLRSEKIDNLLLHR
ncbi:MAG TPA: FeoB small GTPase domain-containing protein, partial [Chitinophaga sp.]